MFGTTTGRQDQQAGGKSSSVVACNGGYSSREEASATDGELPQIVAAPPLNLERLPPPTITESQDQQAGGKSSFVLACSEGYSSGEDTDGELPQMQMAGAQSSRPDEVPRLDLAKMRTRIGSWRRTGTFGAQAREGSIWDMFSWMPTSLIGGAGGSHDPTPPREQPQAAAPQRAIDWRTCDGGFFCDDQEERIEDMGHCFSRPPHGDAPAPAGGHITMEEYIGLTSTEEDHGARRSRSMCV